MVLVQARRTSQDGEDDLVLSSCLDKLSSCVHRMIYENHPGWNVFFYKKQKNINACTNRANRGWDDSLFTRMTKLTNAYWRHWLQLRVLGIEGCEHSEPS